MHFLFAPFSTDLHFHFFHIFFFLHHVQKFKDFVLQSVSNSKRSEQFVKGSIYKAQRLWDRV